jgi:hypothetical protein
LNFDWGSQSIAQSKFQRAPFSGERDSAETFDSPPSIFFPKTFSDSQKEIAERTKLLASFRYLARLFADRLQSKGRETVRVALVSASLFSQISQKTFGEISVEKNSAFASFRHLRHPFSGRPQPKGRGTWNAPNCVQELFHFLSQNIR